MEQGPDFWCWFDTTQFSYHCVHPIHAKMFSLQMLLHFSQIVPRVCTLVLFITIIIIIIVVGGGGGGGVVFSVTGTSTICILRYSLCINHWV